MVADMAEVRDEDRAEETATTEKEDASGTTAPSIGPNTVIEKDSPEERLARHEQSDTDAMGLDKRRQVTGGRYRASRSRQIVVYASVLAFVVAAAVGFKLLADELDQPPDKVADQAPWTGNQIKPKPLQ